MAQLAMLYGNIGYEIFDDFNRKLVLLQTYCK